MSSLKLQAVSRTFGIGEKKTPMWSGPRIVQKTILFVIFNCFLSNFNVKKLLHVDPVLVKMIIIFSVAQYDYFLILQLGPVIRPPDNGIGWITKTIA